MLLNYLQAAGLWIGMNTYLSSAGFWNRWSWSRD